MRPALVMLGLLAAGCGGFHAVDEPGPADLHGCLTLPDAGPASGVPVFFVTDDGGVAAEARSSADGCFSLRDVPSGRSLVVANDFRGLGLVETVRLYASQRLELSKRVLYSLTLNPVLPELRGVGAGEALGDLGSQPFATADEGLGTFRLYLDGLVRTVDASTGVASNQPTCVRATAVPTPTARLFLGSPTEITALTWLDGGTVALPDGANGWQELFATELSFVAHAVHREGQNITPLGFVFGARGSLTPLGRQQPCAVFDDGHCARLTGADAGVTFERWEPSGAWSATDFPVAPDATLLLALLRDDGQSFGAVTTDAAGAIAWWWNPSSRRVEQVAAFPGLRAESGAEATTELPDRVQRLTFDLVDGSGQRTWALLDLMRGTVKTVPLPSIPLGAERVSIDGDPSTADVTRAWATRPDPRTFDVVIAEHMGDRARVRTITLPALDTPNYFALDPFMPTLGLRHATEAGLEVFTVGDEPGLLEPGAPLESAKPVATLGIAATPVFAVGRSLLTFSSAEDLSRQAFRYDIRRIADELARGP